MLQLQIEQCRCDEVDELNEILEDTSAVSITLTDRFDDPILEPAPGDAPLWKNVVIHALYECESDAEFALKMLSEQYPHLTCTLQPLVEQDWERNCIIDFKPLSFGKRLWICPSWVTPPEPDAVNLILDPGLAFGTGTHQTTSLCLTWLEKNDLEHKTIIDYGCGSGILGLAALKLGAQHVYAVDIDDQALLATQNNACNNHIQASQLTLGHPESLHTQVDLILANILLTPLLQLKERFAQLLTHNGMLVVSGLLVDQVDTLADEYQSIFIHHETLLQDDWALMVFSPKIALH
jgi:ribosomal protein L11 methyltransferase